MLSLYVIFFSPSGIYPAKCPASCVVHNGDGRLSLVSPTTVNSSCPTSTDLLVTMAGFVSSIIAKFVLFLLIIVGVYLHNY